MDDARHRSSFDAILTTAGRVATCLAVVALGACGELLPRSEAITDGPWRTYEEAQQAFERIVPHQTTVTGLRVLGLDPESNPNITILLYSELLGRYVINPSILASPLDAGVLECLRVGNRCRGYEVDYHVTRRKRYGNFLADLFNFRRKTEIVGWRFKAMVLVADDIVVYKATGGQPAIHEFEESNNPLGPLQGAGERVFR
ncbi:MAG: hypothetical protein WCV99_22070 [Sterolibacterium sp.]|jgi:hypothetical protein